MAKQQGWIECTGDNQTISGFEFQIFDWAGSWLAHCTDLSTRGSELDAALRRQKTPGFSKECLGKEDRSKTPGGVRARGGEVTRS